VHSSVSSTTIKDDFNLIGVQSLLSVGHRQQLLPPFGGGLGPAVVPWNNIHSATAAVATAAVATAASVACNNDNGALKRSIASSQATAPSLHCQFTGDIMGMTSSIGAATATAFSSSSSSHNNNDGGGRVHPNNATSGGGWSSPELLTGTTLLFAGAAAAASVGSIFLGPNVDDSGLRGTKKTNNVGGDKGGGGTNGKGGGSGGSKNNGSGGGAGGDKYQHSFDSSVKEQDDKGDIILELNEAAAPRAYEVSVSHRTKL
jgi:hypothetical protein